MTKPIPSVFGSVFYSEMPVAYYCNGEWQSTIWQASDRLTIHPAAHCLHYGSEIFEGMKAFRHEDDRIYIFRLDDHIHRLQSSARALYLPIPSAQQCRQMIIELVSRARDDVPDTRGALYLRPLLLGTDPLIGNACHPSQNGLLLVLASPSGDYFKQGSSLTILVETQNARCAPHMGSIKCGGNYASALHWAMEAEKAYGAQQVLFCPNGDVQETGASNFMLIDDKTIITKALTNEFLHGITRASLLEIAADNGYRVEERPISVAELKEKIAAGAEAALTGTAAVLSPVTHLVIDGQITQLKSSAKGLQLRQLMTDIQYGRAPDKYGWLTHVC